MSEEGDRKIVKEVSPRRIVQQVFAVAQADIKSLKGTAHFNAFLRYLDANVEAIKEAILEMPDEELKSMRDMAVYLREMRQSLSSDSQQQVQRREKGSPYTV